MFYQWGRKDPFTFATSSEQWGSEYGAYGKYSVKIYTIDGVLIYQESNGGTNIEKQPAGGVIVVFIDATSMMGTIKNPIIFNYGGSSVINQSEQTRDLWNYYWISHSRGTDGVWNKGMKAHNQYLDNYLLKKTKSIYDPCPYGFKIPSNGTYNYFTNVGWTQFSYAGGSCFGSPKTWSAGLGLRSRDFRQVGYGVWYHASTSQSQIVAYQVHLKSTGLISCWGGDNHEKDRAHSVRCIEG